MRIRFVFLALTIIAAGGFLFTSADAGGQEACVPALISPQEGAVLDNGRTDFQDPIIWDFDWSDCNAASQYHLYVIGPTATIPLVDLSGISESSYRVDREDAFIIDANRLGWRWRVRAMVDGVWGAWSDFRNFDVEPVNSDPSSVATPTSTPTFTATSTPTLTPSSTPTAIATPSCIRTLDIMLVLDGSRSITPEDFELLRDFAGKVVASFAVDPVFAHIGVVQFEAQGLGRVEIGLSDNAMALNAAIDAMVQIAAAGTDIQEGISLAQGEISANGRSGVPHVISLLTDGEHNQGGDPVAEAAEAKAAGTVIFVTGIVGTEGIDIAELNAIASDPDEEHVFQVDEFADLANAVSGIVMGTCDVEVPTPAAKDPGDVNDDGSVNSIDAAVVLQYDAGLIGSLRNPDSADVSQDGNINSVDAVLILQFEARLLDSLPP